LLLDGLTLVISPLIALMKDQLDFLLSRGVPAARLDSSLTREETLQVHEALNSGRLKLLYVSPERLGNERFLRSLERRKISLLAVDEAHCISEWGHNFRPDYLKIARLARQLAVERVLALTATATPGVARDIAEGFGIAAGDVVHTGFYRPNLKLYVTPCDSAARDDLLLSHPRWSTSRCNAPRKRWPGDSPPAVSTPAPIMRAWKPTTATRSKTRSWPRTA
jgi:ATP-dependent DNA helicase RecQ